ncbi:conserved hypothetical protein [Burkholderia mallei PRL-20]|uniref:Uncharacterized protein n=2 Tax=Burkholderia pseudomallei TaxID=28450 RepID=A0A0E1W4A2_BURPE|nr:hypothetical protein BMASAVP1_0725 [Burkholderia mallei SAVP1]ABN94878.1 hypothetical protein BURPS1106A_A0722 [Burkholderia pseudomallei 1106a]AFR18697.1 hypothetical protein BPC006_II0766 [Burkholderia pseudomallei BPC006]EBA45714.1 hypothetical protein BURPS305_7729 [Burkholderia pseudomallei 305]EEC32484.1 conserved hypothetical protein [Burkholderia pseudomallei 576]EEH27377.1 conserved hypothetical protein [Burkholderia pseudomallei Pakistan 9]EES21042.1 hypothetical protein BURPS110
MAIRERIVFRKRCGKCTIKLIRKFHIDMMVMGECVFETCLKNRKAI